jgi:hypothetical protein
MQLLKLSAAAGVLAALCGAAMPAQAGMITYDSYSVIDNVNVTIGYPGISPGPYGSGEIQYSQGGNVVATTYCIDVTHDLYGSGEWNVTNAVDSNGVSNIDNAGGSGTGTLLSWSTLGELGALAEYGNTNLGSNPNLSAATQLAIWDVEYGSAITTTSASADVQKLAAALVWDATTGRLGSDTDVAWLHYCDANGCNQGQLELLGDGNFIDPNSPFDTPEPSSLAIFGGIILGLTGFGAVRRRFLAS